MASYTAPTIHATGDDLAVTDYNQVANNTTFLYQRPYIAAFNSFSTALATGAFTQVTLGGIAASGYGFSVSSNNIIVPLTGTYAVSGAIATTLATGATLAIGIYHNGTNTIQAKQFITTGADITATASGVIIASAGDSFALQGYQNQGTAAGTETGANLTFLHAYFIGSQ